MLILWALVGGLFLRSNDPLPLQSTEVSLLTSEEFAALSVPDASPTVPTEAPEVVAPAEHAKAGRFLPTCGQKSQEYLTAIWTELQK